MDIAEIIRHRIRTCGHTRYHISKETSVTESDLCRLMQGNGCSLQKAGELLDYFNLVIVPRDKKSAIGADAHSKPKGKRGEK
ncbi:MAG: hypothetical protein JXB18_12250 [Sedimentisphaerales bacterium]|nr:hypothetical protein [Sedimentisphaerales bacterium]